jgi:hypothetical protein
MSWKNLKRIGEGVANVAKKVGEDIKERAEEHESKEKILEKLRMSQLEELAYEFDVDVDIEGFRYEDDEPRRDDFIRDIADQLSLEEIENFVKEKGLEKKLKSIKPEYAKNVTFIDGSTLNMNKSSFSGDVTVNENVFNDFSKQVMNLDIDPNLKMEALKNIGILKEELSKSERDNSKIDKIIRWFSENKTELATIAASFIPKILGSG